MGGGCDMAKKIIMILSLFSNNRERKVFSYSCPDGRAVEGALSNEPSIKYLLEDDPAITEILCICSPEARSDSLDYFTDMIGSCYPDRITVTPIDYDDKKTSFENEPLKDILSHTSEGDEICLDTTGGKRNDIMHLLFITRVLSYTGISVRKVVYTQWNPNEVRDITFIARMFDLVEGVQDLSSFGNIGKLRNYYGTPAQDARIEALLVSVERLVEAITLCKVDYTDELVEEFNDSLSHAAKCDDVLMRQLLPTFQKKFGKDKKLKIPGLIRWCLESGMIQQALTVYVERMPDYLINQRKSEYLTVSQNTLDAVECDGHHNQYASWLSDNLLNLSYSLQRYKAGDGEKEVKFTLLVRENAQGILYAAFQTSMTDFPCEVQEPAQQTGINNLIALLRAVYPLGGAYAAGWEKRLPDSCRFMKHFSHYLNDSRHPASAEIFLKDFYIPDNALIKLLCQTLSPRHYSHIEGQCTYVATIENFEELLEEYNRKSGQRVTLKCSPEQMKTILRDYIYLKMLRNMISHAAPGNIPARAAQEWYLTRTGDFAYKGKSYRYPTLDGITASQVIDVLSGALEHIKK